MGDPLDLFSVQSARPQDMTHVRAQAIDGLAVPVHGEPDVPPPILRANPEVVAEPGPHLLGVVEQMRGSLDVEVGKELGSRRCRLDGIGLGFTQCNRRIGDAVSYTHLTLPTNREV